MTDYSSLPVPSRTEVSTIAVYYDLSGFTSAMNDGRKFRRFAAPYLQRVNAFVAKELGGRITEWSRAPTLKLLGDGGLYLFEARRGGIASLLEHLAERSARVIQRFPDRTADIVESFSQDIEDVPRDIRIVITAGPCYKYRLERPADDPAAPPDVVTDYVGRSLNLGGRLSHVINGGQAVAWLGRMPAVDLRRFEYKKRDLAGRVRDFPDVRHVWWYNRQPSSQQIAPHRGWAPRLARGLHLSKTHVEDQVRHYQAPENYHNLRQTLFQSSLVILHGIPGVGKTTTALRLLTDCQEHGLVPRMPRVGRKTWKDLKGRPEDEVVWLDDPFGKERSTPERVKGAATGLLDFLEKGKARVIITTRTDVFYQASESFREGHLAETLRNHLWPLEKENYVGLNKLVVDRAGENTALGSVVVNELLEAVAELDLRLPLDAVDLAAKIRGSLTDDEARASLSQFTESLSRGGPKERYLAELTGMSRERDLMFMFLTRSLANGVMNSDALERVFGYLIEGDKVEGDEVEGDEVEHVKRVWQECGKNWDRWGWWKWQPTGVCAMRHQLREEALAEFFAKDPKGWAVIDRAFERLSRTPAPHALEAIAIAVPQLGSRLPDQGRRVLRTLMDTNDERAMVRLAESIGHHFAEAESGAVGRSQFRDVLAAALRELLGRAEERVRGAAAAAVCDNYGPWVDGATRTAVVEVALDGGPIAAAHVAWAVVSNFAKVHDELRRLVTRFTTPREGREWVRLRAVEALADYYEEVREAGVDKKLRTKVRLEQWASDREQGPIVQRGIVGAVEANFEELPNAGKLLLGLGDRSENPELLEWVVWTWGERFKELTKDRASREDLLSRLTRLATHEDLRVRKWVAEALYNNVDPKDEEYEEFVGLLAKLAEDDSDHVRNAAAGFFGEEEDDDG